MKAVVTADNHLNKNFNKMRASQLEKRREELKEQFGKAVQHAIDIDADLFIHCGDLFDMPHPKNDAMAYAARKIMELENSGVRTFLVVGNHDMSMSSDKTESSPHSIFESFQASKIFMNCDETETEKIDIDGIEVGVSGLSYNPLDESDDPLEGKEIEKADVNIVASHYGTETLSHDKDRSITQKSIKAISPDVICLGHIHKHRSYSIGDTNVIVPGSTARMSFDEKDYSTGFYKLEFDENNVEAEYVEIDDREMRKEEIQAEEINTDDATEFIRNNSSEDQMFELELVGELSREDFRNLELHALRDTGKSENFFFDLKDSIQLDSMKPDIEGGRLSQVNELKNTAEEVRKSNPSSKEIVRQAREKVLSDYGDQ